MNDWVFLSYKSKVKIKPRSSDHYPYGTIQSGVKKSRRKIFVYGTKLSEGHYRELKIFLNSTKSGILIFPEELLEDFKLKLISFPLTKVNEKKATWKHTYDVFITEFLGIALNSPKPSLIHVTMYVDKTTDNQVLSLEENMTISATIKDFWSKDLEIKNILFQSFLLNEKRKAEVDTVSNYSEVRRRTGLPIPLFQNWVHLLERHEIFEGNDTCFLRMDNGAYETIYNVIKNEYHIDIILENKKGENITGVTFLNYAYENKKTSGDLFVSAIVFFLRKYMPSLEEMDINKKDEVFEFVLPGKWYAVFHCHTKHSPLSLVDVATVHLYKEEINKSVKMDSSFAVVIGHAFDKDSIRHAENIEVFLLSAFDFLKIAFYISKLTPSYLNALPDYFPTLFSEGGGVVNIERVLERLDSYLKEA